MRGLGTLINVVAIVAGTGAGMLVGPRLPGRVRETVLQVVGLVVVVIGITAAAGSHNIVFPLVALVLGAIIGELLAFEDRLERLGERIKAAVVRRRPDQQDAPFVEAFVTATLVFAVGPLAILGSIDDGLRSDPQLLVVKASLDGLVSVMFASTLGLGVAFSAVPVGLYQGLVTLLAGAADRVLDDRMVIEMTAAGGVMIAGIGVRLLDVVRVRVASLLPALVLAPIGVALFAR